LKEAGKSHQHGITIFLHLQRLPLDDGGYCALHARFVAHIAMNGNRVARADGRSQHQVGDQRTSQGAVKNVEMEGKIGQE
jgi:hypothetical protein